MGKGGGGGEIRGLVTLTYGLTPPLPGMLLLMIVVGYQTACRCRHVCTLIAEGC